MQCLSCRTRPWRRAQRALARAGGCSQLLCVLPACSLFVPLFVWIFQPSPRGSLSLIHCTTNFSLSWKMSPRAESEGEKKCSENNSRECWTCQRSEGAPKSLRSTDNMTARDSRISNNLPGKKQLSKLFSTHFKIFHTDLIFLPGQTFSL